MSDLAANPDRLLELAGAICDEIASHDDFVELDAILSADQVLCSRYADYCRMHGALRLELRAHWAAQKACQQINFESTVATVGDSSAASPSPIPTSSHHPPQHHRLVLFGLAGGVSDCNGGFRAWAVRRLLDACFRAGTGCQAIVSANRSVPEPKMELVGRITGMVDCKWAGTAFDSPDVPLGRKYELASGLVEITYDTGAKVLLQGPVTYEVESAAGGICRLAG